MILCFFDDFFTFLCSVGHNAHLELKKSIFFVSNSNFIYFFVSNSTFIFAYIKIWDPFIWGRKDPWSRLNMADEMFLESIETSLLLSWVSPQIPNICEAEQKYTIFKVENRVGFNRYFVLFMLFWIIYASATRQE